MSERCIGAVGALKEDPRPACKGVPRNVRGVARRGFQGGHPEGRDDMFWAFKLPLNQLLKRF